MDWTVQSKTMGEWVNCHPELHTSDLNAWPQVIKNSFTSSGEYKLALNQVAQATQQSLWLNATE